MRRLNWPLLALALFWALLLWGAWTLHGARHEARIANARADSVATEAAAAAVREAGYQAILASLAPRLTRHVPDTIGAALASHGAEPVGVATVQVSASGVATAPASDPVSPDNSTWTARIESGPLTLDATVDHPARRLSVEYAISTRGELVGALMPDGRLMVAARGLDEGVMWEVPALYWRPPAVEEPGFPWGCVASAAGTGAGAVKTRGTARKVVIGTGLLVTWRACR